MTDAIVSFSGWGSSTHGWGESAFGQGVDFPVEATGSVGSIEVVTGTIVSPTGEAATGSEGTVSVVGVGNTSVTGEEGTGSVGTVVVSAEAVVAVTGEKAVTSVWQGGESLIGYLPFNGDTLDHSNSGLTVTEVGSITYAEDRDGNADSAIVLAGSTEYLTLPAGSWIGGTGDWALALWYHTTDTNGRLFDTRGTGSLFTKLGLQITTSNGTTFNNTYIDSASASVGPFSGVPFYSNDTWHHITLNYDSSTGTLAFYQDGTHAQSLTDAGLIGVDITSSLKTTIGRASNTNTQQYAGEEDDLRVYDRLLTAGEIAYLGGATHEIVDAAATVAVTGEEGTGSVGTVSVVGVGNTSVTGEEGTGSEGTVTVDAEATATPTGETATGATDDVTVTGIGNVELTGISVIGFTDDVYVSGEAIVIETGEVGTTSVGTVNVIENISFSVTGEEATGATDDVTVTGIATFEVGTNDVELNTGSNFSNPDSDSATGTGMGSVRITNSYPANTDPDPLAGDWMHHGIYTAGTSGGARIYEDLNGLGLQQGVYYNFTGGFQHGGTGGAIIARLGNQTWGSRQTNLTGNLTSADTSWTYSDIDFQHHVDTRYLMFRENSGANTFDGNWSYFSIKQQGGMAARMYLSRQETYPYSAIAWVVSENILSATGEEATGSVGSVTVTGIGNVPVTGEEGVGATRNVSIDAAAIVAVTGEEGTADTAPGTLNTRGLCNVFPTGEEATGAVGTVGIVESATIPVTGEEATGSVESVTTTSTNRIDVTGEVVSGSVGTVIAYISIIEGVTGEEATGSVGTVLVWECIAPIQTPSWAGIGPVQVPAYSTIAPVQTPSWAGIGSGTTNWTEVTPTQNAGWGSSLGSGSVTWTPISPSQTPTYTGISITQVPGYTATSPAQSPGWSDTGSGTTNWTEITPSQSPTWGEVA